MADTQWFTESNSSRISGFLIPVLLIFSFLFLGSWGVLESSEARYAEIGREMLQSHDWLYPRLLGILHLHKPPVVYMVTALGLKFFGITPFGARFFLQISLAIQAILVYRIGCLLFKEKRPALLAMAVYMTMPAVMISARNLTTDSILATFELFAILCWIRFKLKGDSFSLICFYLSLAFAFLTKGPVGLLFPILVCAGYRNGKANIGKVFGRHLLSFLLFLIIGFSWYVILIMKDSRLIDYFLVKHTVQRMMNPEAFGRSEPWWFFLVLAPALSLPWSVMPFCYWKDIRLFQPNHIRLLIFWILIPLAFFSLSSSKLIPYILPMFSGLAILVGNLLHILPEDRLGRFSGLVCLFFIILALVPMVSSMVMIPWPYLSLPIAIAIGTGIIWATINHFVDRMLVSGLLFYFLLLPFSSKLLAHNMNLTHDTRTVAQFLQANRLDLRPVVVYDQLLPSLAFHLNTEVITVHDQNASVRRDTEFEKDMRWKAFYLDLQDPEDKRQLQSLLDNRSVLVGRGPVPSDREWLVQGLQQHPLGRWVIYY